jgi:hypothetical protein
LSKTNVTSRDPRKPQIVAALKQLSGGNKVTLVKQVDLDKFEGRCLKGNRYGYEVLGTFTVHIKFSNEG